MEHVIITGASRGLGAAMSRAFLEDGATVHALARSEIPATKNQYSYQVDIGDVQALVHTFRDIFASIDGDTCTSVTLINNAGLVSPVGPAAENDPDEIATSIAVNVSAPMIAAREFLQHSSSLSVHRTVLNISFGAGKSPMEGWSAYCTGKAGLDMYTKTAALEQEDAANPARFLAVAPGIVDTDMQSTIRDTSKESFKHVDKFRDYKKQGSLSDPDVTAAAMLRLLADRKATNGKLLDIREYL
ncbi:(S)-benzoin forming benzil reductase [Natribacillus halophilus]|uniref:Benzil reductase ((S)-benzoin forming) n=1 Tax=Natribacillus halophilus TaxID=549003 RepID=A0A1G8LL20_9BACI|nr:(S)-benzoin forming benzil reductase [Natribacillus halophilus]SDI56366.1 benzil reductase ((S)-benzoin forming) [Natribacillus halophilus]